MRISPRTPVMTNSHPSSSEEPSRGSRSTAFEALHEDVRRWIWQQGWTELRDAQEAAVEPILGGSADVIISAATARGKTEAAFLPICSRLAHDAAGSVRALYVGPLKALINDQFRRLEDLCDQLRIPVHRWHGDVPSGRKRAVLKQPSGVLLITPESLEAISIIHGTSLRSIFDKLDYVVVDELHAFIGTERGRQLQSLLNRLELAVRRRIPRIALSATLGDMQIAADFLRPNAGADVRQIASSESGQELKLLFLGYERREPKVGRGEDCPEPASEMEFGDEYDICRHLYRSLRGRDNLVFANSRGRVEIYADRLRRMSEDARVPNEFLPHHGSLSKELREHVEQRLKAKGDGAPLSVVCTTTLEMGIDIGSVHSVAQIGSPPGVASLRQRLGRSGRLKGEPAILRLYVQENEITPQVPPQDALRSELVQTIAMTELLLEGWFEPPLQGQLHLSTLVQQTLSLIAQHGGVQAKEAFSALCRSGPFGTVDSAMYAEFLRSLAEHDLIQQDGTGTLLLGVAGERLVNHYTFYAAFTSPEQFRVMYGEKTLGSIPLDNGLREGMFIILAGRRWRIATIDLEQKTIYVTTAKGGRPPGFVGSGIMVHDRVHETMRSLYAGVADPRYLNADARRLLAEGRDQFARLQLHDTQVVPVGKDVLLFPWKGDWILNTLALQFNSAGLQVGNEGVALLIADVSPDGLVALARELADEGPADPLELASLVPQLESEKHHQFMSQPLLVADYASRMLDTKGAHAALRTLAASSQP